MKNCLQCGKLFKPARPKAKFCSDACRKKYSRKSKLSAVDTVQMPKQDMPAPPSQQAPAGDPLTDKLLRQAAYTKPTKMEAAYRLRKLHGKLLPGEQ